MLMRPSDQAPHFCRYQRCRRGADRAEGRTDPALRPHDARERTVRNRSLSTAVAVSGVFGALHSANLALSK
jgi:hypothetical protein